MDAWLTAVRMGLKTLVAATVRAETFRLALLVGAAGLSAVLMNLILAQALTAETFALVSLVQTAAFFVARFSSLGIAQASPRIVAIGIGQLREFPWTGLMKNTALRYIVPVSVVATLVLSVWLGFPVGTAITVLLVMLAVAMGNLLGNMLRPTGRLLTGQAIVQAWRFCSFVLVGGTVLLLGGIGVSGVMSAFAVASLLVIGMSWAVVTSLPAGRERLDWERVRNDGRAFLLVSVTLALATYVDRLLAPRVIGMEAYASYALVWWVVGMPFSIVESSIGFYLLPILRREPSVSRALRLLRSQTCQVLAAITLIGLVGVWITPRVVGVLYGDKYDVGGLLTASIVLASVLRSVGVVPSAMIGAWGRVDQVRALGAAGLLGVVVAAVGVVIGGSLGGGGGVAIGLAAGMTVRLLASIVLSRSALENRRRVEKESA